MKWVGVLNHIKPCLNLSCLPKPSFADMSCCVGDMSSFMPPTRRHCMSARVSKRHDIIWRHVRDSWHFGNFVIVVSAQTQKLYGSYGSFWGVEWVTSLWPVATVKGAQTLYIYIYKEDLLWVWTVWGVSIISSNRGSKCESMSFSLRAPPVRPFRSLRSTMYWPAFGFKWIWRMVLLEKKYC